MSAASEAALALMSHFRALDGRRSQSCAGGRVGAGWKPAWGGEREQVSAVVLYDTADAQRRKGESGEGRKARKAGPKRRGDGDHQPAKQMGDRERGGGGESLSRRRGRS